MIVRIILFTYFALWGISSLIQAPASHDAPALRDFRPIMVESGHQSPAGERPLGLPGQAPPIDFGKGAADQSRFIENLLEYFHQLAGICDKTVFSRLSSRTDPEDLPSLNLRYLTLKTAKREFFPVVRTGAVHEEPHNDKTTPGRQLDHACNWRHGRQCHQTAAASQQVRSPAVLEDKPVPESRSRVACASPPAAGARLYGNLPWRELSRDSGADRHSSLAGADAAVGKKLIFFADPAFPSSVRRRARLETRKGRRRATLSV